MPFPVKKTLFAYLFCSTFLFLHKLFAFDFESYHHQQRSVPSVAQPVAQPAAAQKHEKSSVQRFVSHLLESFGNDIVPVKMFDTSKKFSIYFKPAKVTKLGIRYKF